MIDFATESISFYTVEGGSIGTSSNPANTWSRYHLMPLSSIVVNPPEFKGRYVDLPSDEGEIDLSYMDRRLNLGMRTGEWTFKLYPTYDYHKVFRQIANELHGGRFTVIPQNEDKLYEYSGRITVDSWRSDPIGRYITLAYRLDPYKIDPDTYVSQTVSVKGSGSSYGTTKTVNVPLTRMPSAPLISAEINEDDDEVIIVPDDGEWTGTLRVAYHSAGSSAGDEEQRDLKYNDMSTPANVLWTPIRFRSGTFTTVNLTSYTMVPINIRYKGPESLNVTVTYKGGWI